MIKLLVKIYDKSNIRKLKYDQIIHCRDIYGCDISGYFFDINDYSINLMGVDLDHRIDIVKKLLINNNIVCYNIKEI